MSNDIKKNMLIEELNKIFDKVKENDNIEYKDIINDILAFKDIVDKEDFKLKCERYKELLTGRSEEDNKLLSHLLYIDECFLERDHYLTGKQTSTIFKDNNIAQEIIKYWDFLNKDLVGIEPMVGPVGLVYALRFRQSANPDPNVNIDEVGLTIVDKEIAARTLKIKTENKSLGEVVANHTNVYIVNSILDGLKDEKLEILKNVTDIMKIGLQMFVRNHVGYANILSYNPANEKDVKKFITKDMKLSPNEYIPTDHVLLSYKGKRENDNGAIFCPYIIMFPSKMVEKEEWTFDDVMTRFNLSLLDGWKNYYTLAKIV